MRTITAIVFFLFTSVVIGGGSMQSQIQGQYSDNDNQNSNKVYAGGGTAKQSQSSRNKNSNLAHGGDGGNADVVVKLQDQNDANAFSGVDGSGNSENAIDQKIVNTVDASDRSSYSYTYREVYRAPNIDSSTLLLNSAPCKTFLGLQFSGARQDGSAGIGLGIPIDDKDCKLDKGARLAFSVGNFELGWHLFCLQPQVHKSYKQIARQSGINGGRFLRQHAYRACKSTGVDIVATRSALMRDIQDIRDQIEVLSTVDGYDDTELRRRLEVLEDVAHLPNQGFLLKDKGSFAK